MCEPGYSGKDCSILSYKFETCKNNCHSNGICRLEKCFCYPGFSGLFCEVKHQFTCPPILSKNITDDLNLNSTNIYSPCSDNGICKYGLCFCYPGFSGVDCSHKEPIQREPLNSNKSAILQSFNAMHFREKEIEVEVNNNLNDKTEESENFPEETLRMVYSGIALLVMILAVLITLLLNRKEIFVLKQ